jgi:hypothetical protein
VSFVYFDIKSKKKLPIRFVDYDQVTSFDENGNEVISPKCECGKYKSQVIGINCYKWICTECKK